MTPPRVAVWLAGCRLASDEREFALGDLDEEFADRLSRDGRRAARRWYWRQAARACLTRRPRTDALPSPSQPRRPVMQNLLQDIRFALRLLRRAPAFTTVVTLTLALGIGATTAIFSVVHAALLKPLPFKQADRLVIPQNGTSLADSTPLSRPRLLQWRDESGVFEDLAGYFNWEPTLTGVGDAEQIAGVRSTASLFSTLGVEPILGHLFTRVDESRSTEPVVLISERFWRSRFASDPAIVGRRMTLNDQAWTIIGVLPGWFRELRPSARPYDLVGPLRLTEQSAPASLNFLSTVARLKSGQSAARAQQQLLDAVLRATPDAQPRPAVLVTPLRDGLVANSKAVLLALMGAVGFLLLITCANLANLLLARAVNRRREIAVRVALGAGRARILTQLLTECLVLAIAGGATGMLVAWAGVRSVARLSAIAQAGVFDLGLDWSVFAFAAGISLAVGVLFGLIPALQAGRVSLTAVLRSGTRQATGRDRLRSAFIVAEVALTLVLLVGAGLLTRSLARLVSVDKGFTADSVLSFTLSTSQAKYPNAPDQTRFFTAVVDRLSRLPGVEGVGLASHLPLVGGDTNGGVAIDGRTFPPGEEPVAEKRIVSAGYFGAMGIPIRRGRVFTEADDNRAAPVIVVSEAFARRWFPGADAVGQRIGFNWDMDGLQTIVGVVADVKHNGLDDPANPAIYVTYTQRASTFFNVVVKATVRPDALTTAVRREVGAIDPDRPLGTVRTMDAVISASVGARRLSLELVGGFALLGLLLAATGIYGVISYSTQQRSREFGIRLALGAGGGSVVRLVLRQGLVLAGIGLALGLAAALALGGLIRAQLFGVEPADPMTLASVSGGLVVVALAACYLPARRAVAIDPATVLRSE